MKIGPGLKLPWLVLAFILVLVVYLGASELILGLDLKNGLRGRVAYLADDGQVVNLYTLDLSTRSIAEISHGVYEWPPPCWLDSGKTLVFGSKRGSAQHLWASALDGASARNLTPDEGYANQLACPYTGHEIVYHAPSGLILLDVVSGQRKILIESGNQFVGYPTWSRNGQWIAYLRGTGQSGGPQRLCVTDRQGFNTQCISEDAAMFSPPVWSPSGEELAYQVEGTDVRFQSIRIRDGFIRSFQMPPQAGFDQFAWSPDGNTIVYAAGFPNMALFRRDFEMKDPTVLAGGIPRFLLWPSGEVILFTALGNPKGIIPCLWKCGRAIFTMDPNGAHVRRLTSRYKDIHALSWSIR